MHFTFGTSPSSSTTVMRSRNWCPAMVGALRTR
jgi:hypothetical protein